MKLLFPLIFKQDSETVQCPAVDVVQVLNGVIEVEGNCDPIFAVDIAMLQHRSVVVVIQPADDYLHLSNGIAPLTYCFLLFTFRVYQLGYGVGPAVWVMAATWHIRI